MHTHISLDSLISMASKKGKRECVLAVGKCSVTSLSDCRESTSYIALL